MTATLTTSDIESSNSRHLKVRKVGLPRPHGTLNARKTLCLFFFSDSPWEHRRHCRRRENPNLRLCRLGSHGRSRVCNSPDLTVAPAAAMLPDVVQALLPPHPNADGVRRHPVQSCRPLSLTRALLLLLLRAPHATQPSHMQCRSFAHRRYGPCLLSLFVRALAARACFPLQPYPDSRAVRSF